MTKHTDEIFKIITTIPGTVVSEAAEDADISEAIAKIEALIAPKKEITMSFRQKVAAIVEEVRDFVGHSELSKQHATKVVEQIVEEFEDQMPKKYVPHAEVKLLELEGKLIELAIRFEGGVVDVVGRVRLVKGGESCDTVLWVGEACVSVDAIVYLDGIRKYWVFESTRYNKPKR